MSENHPFDRRLLRQRRERQAGRPQAAEADFLFEEAASRLGERLRDIRRPFTDILELGARRGALLRQLDQLPVPAGGRRVVALDHGWRFARALPADRAMRLVADEEVLPFAPASFDLVLANLSLHHVNDLPGLLAQIRQILRPDGCFLAVMPGGETLGELRACLVEAETALTGGAFPRISPMAELRQMAGLLQRAGFALPVVDHERITVRYTEPLNLLAELRAMGESNIHRQRARKPLPRAVLARALTLYRERFGGEDGRVPASFELIFLLGWCPDASQPQPLARGSGQQSLAAVLGGGECPTPETR